MVDLRELVEKELSSAEGAKNLILLWRDIHSWYEEGGPDNIADNLKGHLKDAERKVSQTVKTLPEVKSRKKTKRRGK
ncbi:MAG: hypothetical protein ACREBU_13590 [Nitrososphaera sp.]